jgi:pyruvate-ferredoxin/flavodoxin oxidoreductase
VAVLDRTKEPGSAGEPLYLDVTAALHESISAAPLHLPIRLPRAERGWGDCPGEGFQATRPSPRVIGGRYGLSSKEFTPAMVKAVFEELEKHYLKNHFTIGINDDVTHTSLDYNPDFSTEAPETTRALFYGLGADGTVGANKNSIKIIGQETRHFAQGYFVYDSKKSGSVTISHLRFGPRPIRSSYLIRRASFVACHQFGLLERQNVLEAAEPGATFLLNSPHSAEEVWNHLTVAVQRQILEKKLRFFVLDAYRIAREAGLSGRISTIMQMGFFALTGILSKDAARTAIKKAIEKSFGKRGEAVVQKNFAAVDVAADSIAEVSVPAEPLQGQDDCRSVNRDAPAFVRNVLGPIIQGAGDDLPVSALPVDGTYPSGTTRWEKRNIAQEIPVWDENICIQCGKCVFVCPHAVIRSKVYAPEVLQNRPATFKSVGARWQNMKSLSFTLQVAPEDCTGCALCIQICPVKSKDHPDRRAINMEPQGALREKEAANWDYFLKIPDPARNALNRTMVKDVQLLQPLFEFSGACAGCGETPYVKLLSQLFGDRLVVANATGCSSIYGGNLPATPWTVNQDGRGPAWSNSLFEDNAEFGLGMRLSLDKQAEYARELLQQLRPIVGEQLVKSIVYLDQSNEAGIQAQRENIARLKLLLQEVAGNSSPGSTHTTRDQRLALNLLIVADTLVKKSVWVMGGDGWAYDIGFGGLDHVIASGHKVNILVLDTEVYSNTGGQMSKSTPRGAVAKFAAGGKQMPKKDLARIAMTYGSVYVARVAFGGNDGHALKAFLEAEAFKGPSLIIAYSHCIAHGYDLVHGLEQQKAAVLSGYWPLFRFNPERAARGENPLQLDSREPSLPLEKYIYGESRYTMLRQSDPDAAKVLLERSQNEVAAAWRRYEYLARMPFGANGTPKDGTT